MENCYWVQLDSIPPPSSSFTEDTRLWGSFRWKYLKPNVTFHAGIKQTLVHFQDILTCRKHALNKSRNPGDVCHFGSVMSCWRVTQTARQQLACNYFFCEFYTQMSENDAVRESRDITRWFTHLPGLPERGCWVRYILWSGWFSRSAKCHRWGWGQRSPTETPHHPVLHSPQKWHLRARADSYLGLSEAYKETEAIANLHREGNWLAWLILLTGLLFSNIYIYPFGRCFYPKPLKSAVRYLLLFLSVYMFSRIEHMTLTFLALCSTSWVMETHPTDSSRLR